MKSSKWLCVLLTVMMALVSAVALGCEPTEEIPPDGAEMGVYYCTTASDSFLTLSTGHQFTLIVDGKQIGGTFRLEGDALTLSVLGGEATLSLNAKLNADEILLEYDGIMLKFLRAKEYTVSYETNGGSAIEAQKVLNGKTIVKPADPVKEGSVFLGWYADSACTVAYNFESAVVTSDITLYARWAEKGDTQVEYIIKFDVNAEGVEQIADKETIGGKLYDVPVPTREGYTFGGWWVSMSNDGDKLSYQYDPEQKFSEDMTLYALWVVIPTGGKLASPQVAVSATGASWQGVLNATSYRVEIKAPNGEVETRNVTANKIDIDFEAKEPGEYEIKVTAVAANAANNSEPTIRYYANKCLARVSRFEVVEPSTLIFNAVDGAEKYLITISCGNPEHKHKDIDNGKSTTYNFSNCEMQPGGIKFVVKAEATGKASSVSEEFVYNRELEAVTGLRVDEATQTVQWNSVKNASAYIVKITDASGKVTEVDNGGSTKYDIKYFSGKLTISVCPKTKGYNSPVASEIEYNKTKLATPSGIKVSGTEISWEAVTGATGYEVRVGNKTYTVTEAKVDVSDAISSGAVSYTISVKATGAEDSLWSDAIEVRNGSMSENLSYHANVITWEPVIGAVLYEVRVNDGETKEVDGSETSAEVVLTKGGVNVISVRYYDGKNYSDWVSTEVYAYTITFDSQNGAYAAPIYAATGDKITLPTTERDGFEFGGWYNVPGGASKNGLKYNDDDVMGSSDIIVYAYWTAQSYMINLDYAGGSGNAKEIKVYFGDKYTVEVPVNEDKMYAFVGWYSEPNGKGEKLTDEFGNSLNGWNIPENTTIYACWHSVLNFTMLNDGTYAVSKGPGIVFVTTVTIPQSYNDIKITVVEGYAFKDCRQLTRIDIPETISTIETSTAFEGCEQLKEVNIYEIPDIATSVYESKDGVLLYNNAITLAKEIRYVPQSKTGTFVIPDDVSDIPGKAFNNSLLSEIVIPTSVQVIQQSAFYSCPRLEKITFAKPAEGEAGKPLEIMDKAFYNLPVMREIEIPSRANKFGINLFVYCSALENVNIEAGNTVYKSVDGVIVGLDDNTLWYCPEGKIGEFAIPAGVTKIADYAFNFTSKLTKVTLHEFVTEIGERAFYRSGLQSINFTSAILYIGEDAFRESGVKEITLFGSEDFEMEKNVFRDCRNLEKVNISEGITYIPKSTFNGCTALLEVVLPASLVEIDNNAFANCRRLKTVTIAEGSQLDDIGNSVFQNAAQLVSITIPGTVTGIGNSAFSGCISLANVIFAAGTDSLSLSSNVFAGCTSLTELTLPKRLRSVSVSMFTGCVNLNKLDFEPGSSFASEGGIIYSNEKTRIVFALYGVSGSVVIPKSVTEIGSSAFAGRSGITEIKFESDTTEIEIGYDAFSGTGITEISIPTGAHTIGSAAFRKCASLKKVNFAAAGKLTVIEDDTFRGTAIESIVIPAYIEEICDYAFADNRKLKSVTFADGIELYEIMEGTFMSCALTSIAIPASVEEIAEYAFAGNSALTKVEFAADGALCYIGEAAFRYCGLTSLSLPASMEEIDNYAFANNENMTTVTFAANGALDTIREGAFQNCGLTSLSLPATLRRLDDFAFRNNNKLASITFAENDSLTELGDEAFSGAAITELVIPEGMEVLCGATFSHCVNLKKVTLPSTLEPERSYSSYMFMGSNNISEIVLHPDNPNFAVEGNVLFDANKEVIYYAGAVSGTYTIPNGVIEIGDYAFFGNANLKRVIIPGTAEYINEGSFAKSGLEDIMFLPGERKLDFGTESFYGCAALKSVNIPARARQLGQYVFEDCRNLATVTFEEGNRLYNTLSTGMFKNTAIKEITIPSNVTSLGGYVFQHCKDLTTVSFEPNSPITSIGRSVFEGCVSLKLINLPDTIIDFGYYSLSKTGLKHFVIPNGVKKINQSMFAGCTELESVVIPSSVTQIDHLAFADCVSLTSIEIPASITKISSDNPFAGCTGLTAIKVAAGNVSFVSVDGVLYTSDMSELICYPAGKLGEFTIPDSVVETNDYAFAGAQFTSITIPESMVEIAEYAFSGSKVQSVELHSGLECIGEFAFENCKELKSITLPSILEDVEGNPFAGCTALTEINVVSDNSEFVTVDGALYDYDMEMLYSYPSGRTGTFVLPESVTEINVGAFAGSMLTEVVLHDGITEIPEYAFRDSNIERIVIPGSVELIDTGAFLNCKKLTEVKFAPAVVELEIGEEAFRGCTAFKEFTVPSHVSEIYELAFADWTAEQTIYMKGIVGYTLQWGLEWSLLCDARIVWNA